MKEINNTTTGIEINKITVNHTEAQLALAALGKRWQQKVTALREEIGHDMAKVVAAQPDGRIDFGAVCEFTYEPRWEPEGYTVYFRGIQVSETGMPYFAGKSPDDDNIVSMFSLTNLFQFMKCVTMFGTLGVECSKKAAAVRDEILAELKEELAQMENQKFEDIFEDWWFYQEDWTYEALDLLVLHLDSEGNLSGTFSDKKRNEIELPLTEFEADEIADRFAELDWTPGSDR